MTDAEKEAGPRAGDPALGAAARRADADVPADVPAPDEAAGRSEKPCSALSPQIRNQLAMQLRAMYDTIVQQPVPDRFAELIAKLDPGDRKSP